MDDSREKRPTFLARFSGDQIAIAGIVAALIVLILVLASALLT